MDIERLISDALRPLHRRVQNLIGRAIISYVNDSGPFQQIQAERLKGEVHNDLERYGSYGLASRPHAGAECIVLSQGAVRSAGLVIAVEDRRYRLKLTAEGDVALYDDLGQIVYLMRDRIRVQSPALVELIAPSIDLRGDVLVIGKLEVTDDATFDGDVAAGGDLAVDGNSTLGAGATKFLMLADNTPSTKAKAK